MKVITVSASRCRRSTSSLGKVGGLLVSSYARLLSTLSAETDERLRHPYAWLACMIGFASGLQSRPHPWLPPWCLPGTPDPRPRCTPLTWRAAASVPIRPVGQTLRHQLCLFASAPTENFRFLI